LIDTIFWYNLIFWLVTQALAGSQALSPTKAKLQSYFVDDTSPQAAGLNEKDNVKVCLSSPMQA